MEDRRWKRGVFCLYMALLMFLFGACGNDRPSTSDNTPGPSTTQTSGKEPTRDTNPRVLVPERGAEIKENERASIDYSHASQGYVMVSYKGDQSISGAYVLYQDKAANKIYYLKDGGEWTTIPLTYGNGKYTVLIYEKNSAAVRFPDNYILAQNVTVEMETEYIPFLTPSRMVDFSLGDEAVRLAKELSDEAGVDTDLDVVKAVFEYIVTHITYDTDRERQEDGTYAYYYVDVDTVLEEQEGICYDYAVLMTAMLRSQGIPTQFIIGFARPESEGKQLLHAWINVHVEGQGWVRKIEFNGEKWELIDPTFEAADASLADRVGDGEFYQVTDTH